MPERGSRGRRLLRLFASRVGRCRFKLGDFQGGIRDYRRLLELSDTAAAVEGIPTFIVALSQIADGHAAAKDERARIGVLLRLDRRLVDSPWDASPTACEYYLKRGYAADLGLTRRVKSRGVAAFAVVFGVASGCVPLLTGQAVMGSESALRQGLLADPGLLYWPMYRHTMIDFIEERTGQQPDWNKLVFVVNDHGGSGVGLAMLVEAVMAEVVNLHLHLETLERRPAVLRRYMEQGSKPSGSVK